ncbi:MAG: hypothetical protein CYG59_24860 [Chloroflexi bacterium]|nr:MAG: hypothetical protein CYG59_24860 [Chloroflexota bacterium]
MHPAFEDYWDGAMACDTEFTDLDQQLATRLQRELRDSLPAEVRLSVESARAALQTAEETLSRAHVGRKRSARGAAGGTGSRALGRRAADRGAAA